VSETGGTTRPGYANAVIWRSGSQKRHFATGIRRWAQNPEVNAATRIRPLRRHRPSVSSTAWPCGKPKVSFDLSSGSCSSILKFPTTPPCLVDPQPWRRMSGIRALSLAPYTSS